MVDFYSNYRNHGRTAFMVSIARLRKAQGEKVLIACATPEAAKSLRRQYPDLSDSIKHEGELPTGQEGSIL